MATVYDVANYILSARGPMTAMKLEKLIYYCQAWSLVWDDKPLFAEEIQAWANGPVVPVLYVRHRGSYQVDKDIVGGNASTLTNEEIDTIDHVLSFYGDKSSQWLSDLTHSEAPWKDARSGLNPGERGNAVISHIAMAEYYGSL